MAIMEGKMLARSSVRWVRALSVAAVLGALAIGCTLVVDGRIGDATCGDGVAEGTEVCDDGDPSATDGCTDQCQLAVPCTGAAECVSEDLCLGTGACVPVGREGELGCAWTSPVDCDDASPCTADSCDPETGTCWNLLIDAD